MGIFNAGNVSKVGALTQGPLGGVNYMMGANGAPVGYTNAEMDDAGKENLDRIVNDAGSNADVLRNRYLEQAQTQTPLAADPTYGDSSIRAALERRAQNNRASNYANLQQRMGVLGRGDQMNRMNVAQGLMKQKVQGDMGAAQMESQAYQNQIAARNAALGSLFGAAGKAGGMAIRSRSQSPSPQQTVQSRQPDEVY